MKHCRNCGYGMDSSAPAKDLFSEVKLTDIPDKQEPTEGDFSVCFNCGNLSRFDENLDMIPLTAEEFVEINNRNPEEFDLMMKISAYIKKANPLGHEQRKKDGAESSEVQEKA